MFRSIQSRVGRRVEDLAKNTKIQTLLEKSIRYFLIQEFGRIGETLSFKASQENKKLHLRLESKTAANELIIRSAKLIESLKDHSIRVESISID